MFMLQDFWLKTDKNNTIGDAYAWKFFMAYVAGLLIENSKNNTQVVCVLVCKKGQSWFYFKHKPPLATTLYL